MLSGDSVASPDRRVPLSPVAVCPQLSLPVAHCHSLSHYIACAREHRVKMGGLKVQTKHDISFSFYPGLLSCAIERHDHCECLSSKGLYKLLIYKYASFKACSRMLVKKPRIGCRSALCSLQATS